MGTPFAKAPLVELIAELRWAPAGPPAPQPIGMPVVFTADAKIEQFFMALGGELYQSGFQRSERLVPSGFPLVLGNPVVRYRSDDAAKKSVLYQAGADVFSVHGIPPYGGWEDFAPFLQNGLKALLHVRGEGQDQHPITQVTLRYLNFFGEQLLEGQNITSFVSDVLGFCITLPKPLNQAASPKELRNLFLKFVVPVEGGSLNISVGDGKMNNQTGLVMDSAITSTAQVAPEVDAIIKILNLAHDIISEVFMGLTKPIEQLMEPQRHE
jgi:uncharacterized protein (TIGR04255 family)